MITDVITLKLISKHIHKFKNLNAGTDVTGILIEAMNNETDVKQSVTYTLAQLDAKIAEYPKEIDWDNIQCFNLNLYFLKRFTMNSANGSTTPIEYSVKDFKYVTTSQNPESAALGDLNTGMNSYLYNYNQILQHWDKLKINEYIRIQKTYIDCGYIEVYFVNAVNYLIELYKQERKKNIK